MRNAAAVDRTAAGAAPRVRAARSRATLAAALALALGPSCSDPSTSPRTAYELSDLTFGSERSVVLSRWVVRGEVHRFGLGIARVDAPRELELVVEGADAPAGQRRWKARVFLARRSQSIVLGPKDVLKGSGESQSAVDPAQRSLAALRGVELELRSEGAGALARAGELPHLELSSAKLDRELLEPFDLRVLPCPPRVVVGELAPPQSAVWRLPALGGTLELSWRCAALPPEAPGRLRLSGPVEASWWREGASSEAQPTRRGRGTATWELDLERRRFLGFALELDGIFDPDHGAESEVHTTARLQVELRWEPFDGNEWAARIARTTARVWAQSAARALVRVFLDTFHRRKG